MRRISGRVRRSLMAFHVAAVVWCSGAEAQALIHFDLPAQPLARSLNAIGTATNTDVGFDSSQVAGLIAPTLKADLTVDDALLRVLAGTGLRPQHLGDHTIVVTATKSSASDAVERNPLFMKASERGEGPAGSSHIVNVDDDGSGQTLAQVDPVEKIDDESNKKEKNRHSNELAEVVVTGTNIRGEAPVGTTIRTLDRLEIEQSGYATTQELIQSLPQNFRGGAAGASADGYSFSSGSNGGYNIGAGSGVNLRGLGNTATLILVNGHRVASSESGYFTDISTIPLSAIDHIDVLTDGASAIYGSEAIAGVVNIVLKQESQGLETGARYNIANGGFATQGGDIEFGTRWNGGGFTIGGDFTHQDELDVSERPFTSSVPSPTSILPSYRQTALSAALHQHVGEAVEIHGDAQYADKSVRLFEAFGDAEPYFTADTRVQRWSASVGGSFRITDSWMAHYDVAAGQEVDHTVSDDVNPAPPVTPLIDVRPKDRFVDQTIGVTGDVVNLPGGPIKLALGAAYRTEKYIDTGDYYEQQPSYSMVVASRNVRAGYGEIRVPIIGERNAVFGVDKLTVSVAGRIDDYSDFGTTVNPKYGISWFPIASLELRGAYSTSFRAPATGIELASSQRGVTAVQVESFPGPGDSVPVAGVAFSGGAPNLQPERARNLTLGVDWNPVFAPDMYVALNYYNISYKNQLAVAPYSTDPVNTPALASVVTYFPTNAPLSALVNTAIQHGALFYDFTGGAFGANPLAAAQYLYDQRTRNLSATATSGFDLSVRYHFTVGSELFDARLDATRIDNFSTSVVSGAPSISEVNTVGYPARLRLRGLANWTHGDLGASIAANYINGYPDTSAPLPATVSSYTTVDFAARYSLRYKIKVSVAATNVFNRLPPYIYSGTPITPDSHYDPANASPLGRIISLNVSKSW